MAIFDSKKKKTDEAKAPKAPRAKSADKPVKFGVIKNPRITEKATYVSEIGNVYTFDVDVNANEAEVKAAVEALYKVKPLKVNLLAVRGKKVFSRGIVGRKASGKKAYVYLAKGDKIEFA